MRLYIYIQVVIESYYFNDYHTSVVYSEFPTRIWFSPNLHQKKHTKKFIKRFPIHVKAETEQISRAYLTQPL
jgi:hypothetical protein